jgi:hypothetical protein
MDKNIDSKDFHKILKLYEIKICEQKKLIDQLKYKIIEEEQIRNYYINKVNILSKL